MGPERLSFLNAAEYCEGIGATLATIRTRQDLNEAMEVCFQDREEDCWIGMEFEPTECEYYYTDYTRTQPDMTPWNLKSPWQSDVVNCNGCGNCDHTLNCMKIVGWYGQSGVIAHSDCNSRAKVLCNNPEIHPIVGKNYALTLSTS